MKVCILGPTLSTVGGVTTHLNLLISSELAQRYDLLHFQVGSEGRGESVLGKLWRLLIGPVKFLFFLLHHRPDVIHLNTSLDHKSYWRDLVFLFFAWVLRRRIVFQKHGGPLPVIFFSYSNLLTGFFRLSLRMADVIVVLGSEELHAYRRFVPGIHIEEIPNAISVDNLIQRPLVASNPDVPLQLVYLGRMAENKGIFEVVEAVAMLAREKHDVRLTLAGAGPDEMRLRERVQALGVGHLVHFAGPLFGEEKDALWRSADVFVFPTYHREGLPYALLEAMAAGAVPVTTRVGAIPDVMQERVHGLFVPPQDVEALVQAITWLDGDRALLLQVARAGRARVLEQYSATRLEADFESLYMSLARKAP